ncbi:hypothetical protein [Deinococcus xinjiangensis]|uniref:hypothetical protein n=1 Tax=Deinococcus xinjiangensis TaxID=457454 RepID=UPI00336596D6
MLAVLVWRWLAFSIRRPVLAGLLSLCVAALVLGACTYTTQGMAWITDAPEIRLTNPSTAEVMGVLRPVRIVAMSGRLVLDYIGGLL